MDYEKKYNEALQRARKIYDEIVNNEVIGFPGQITDIFPELAESEDERIRESIVATIKQCPYDFLYPKNRDKMLAYLEKQKEQKPAEWSEEDDKIRRNLMSLLSNMRGDRITEETYQKYYPWLSALRPSWKPSEEEVGCLERLIAFKNPEPEDINGCKSLLEQLTKLI